jgi:hypothetical protein
VCRRAGSGQRLGEVAHGHRVEVLEGARGDDLWAPDEDDVGGERVQPGAQLVDAAAEPEVEERGLDTAGGGLQRAVVEVDALAHEGQPQGLGHQT